MVCRVSQDLLVLQEKKVVKENLAFQALLVQWIQIRWAQKARRGTLVYQVFLEFQGQKVIRVCLETQGNLDRVDNLDYQDHQVPKVTLVSLEIQDLQDLLDLKEI